MLALPYKDELDRLYRALNRRELVHPDPLEFLYRYEHPRDREIVALVASGLAYGNVRQILKSVEDALSRMESPYRFVTESRPDTPARAFRTFKHRFTTGEELATLLMGVQRVLRVHGSLQACFLTGLRDEHDTALPALDAFVGELSVAFEGRPRSLLPRPSGGSACKRLNLFLRWLVRQDEVDPGGWDRVSPALLIVPLDVHMHRIALQLGLTRRKQADLKAACEVTNAFRTVQPDDPARFDFCLTRLGIRDDIDPQAFIQLCHERCGQDRRDHRPAVP
jgi:uncharacterized protein (TIGR02757 family)